MSHPSEVQRHGVSEKTNRPLLFLLGEFSGETRHAFFDPVQETLDVVEIPELGSQLHCLASGYGWLLLLSREASSLFFFNPMTRQKIDLPYRSPVFNAAAFSAPPTSPDCRVFAVKDHRGSVLIDTLLVGQERVWTRYGFQIGTKKGGKPSFGFPKQAIVDGDALHCMDLQGRIGTFDIKGRDWKVVASRHDFVPVRLSSFFKSVGRFLGVKSSGEYEKIYELRVENGVAEAWEEAEDLGDVSVAIGPYGSYAFSSSSERIRRKLLVAAEDPAHGCVIQGCNRSEVYDSTPPFGMLHSPIWLDV